MDNLRSRLKQYDPAGGLPAPAPWQPPHRAVRPGYAAALLVTMGAVAVAMLGVGSPPATPSPARVAAPLHIDVFPSREDKMALAAASAARFVLADVVVVDDAAQKVWRLERDDSLMTDTVALLDEGLRPRTSSGTLSEWASGSGTLLMSAAGDWTYSTGEGRAAVACAAPGKGSTNPGRPATGCAPAVAMTDGQRDRLRSVAQRLVSALPGMSHAPVELQSDDGTAVTFTAAGMLDGEETSLLTWVTYDGDGRLISASGYATRPVEVAQLHTLAPVDVLGRLDAGPVPMTADSAAGAAAGIAGTVADGAPTSGGSSAGQGRTAPTGDVPTSVDRSLPAPTDTTPLPGPAVPPTAPTGLDVPTSPVLCTQADPAGCAAAPESEVQLTTVRRIHVTLVDAHQVTWLLPGYRFTAADGRTFETQAVADDVFVEVRPASTRPVPQPVPPAPEPSGTTGTPSQPISSPSELPAVDDLVGMSEKAASDAAAARGLQVRVVARDGKSFPATADWRPDRVNLTVEHGVVRDAAVG